MTGRASLDDLAAFACVARLCSFTRAAAVLGTSISNLSHTIKRLETRLGCRLLQRNSRSVSVTEAGQALVATLGPALGSIEDALDALDHGRDSVSGTLRITMTRQAYDWVVRPVLPAFTAAHPAAAVEVLIEYGFRDIVADGFDAGIRLGEKLEQDMIALKVGPDLRMAVVASPAYLAWNGAPAHPGDLVRHRCINYRMVASATIYAWEFERDDKAFEVRVPGPLSFNDPALMLECALEGLGVAYLAEDQVIPFVRGGQLVRLLAETPFAKSWCDQPLTVWMDGAVEHEADHGELDHGFRHLWQVLVVAGQTAPAAEPAECTLNDPAARQHDEALCSRRAADDDQHEAEQKAG